VKDYASDSKKVALGKSLDVHTEKAPCGQNTKVRTGNWAQQTTSLQSIFTDLVGNLSSHYWYLSVVW